MSGAAVPDEPAADTRGGAPETGARESGEPESGAPERSCVAVTGHRTLAGDEAALRAAVQGGLRAIEEARPGAARRLVSALAEGADRLVAEEGLAAGWALSALLPMPRSLYVEDFADASSRQRFRELLERASEVVEMPATAESGEPRSAAYARLGERLVAECAVLLAVWDGAPARGEGGTAEVVGGALAAGRPVLWVDSRPPHSLRLLVPGDGGPEERAADELAAALREPVAAAPAPRDELRIFISSPGDVGEERAIAKRVVARLEAELSSRAGLTAIFWEHEPLLATASFQEQIVHPAESDIVVSILWSRLGTRLPSRFRRPDGSTYASGTEYEFEAAAEAHREHGRPDLLVYRKTAEPVARLVDRQQVLDRLDQREQLDRFVRRWFFDAEEGTLVAAFHPFETTAEFEELLETHLRKLIERHLPPAPAAPAPAPPPRWREGSPFRGLGVFDYQHAPVFFGRTRAVSEVLATLRRRAEAGKPFALVVGASGVGKSSLVRAGVLPLLVGEGVVEDVAVWRRAVMRPGDGEDPCEALARALVAPEALPEIERGGTGAAALARLLAETPAAAPAVVGAALARAADATARQRGIDVPLTARLALVVDQLEEVFADLDPGDRGRFFAALEALAASGVVWTIATLRSDFFPRAIGEPALPRLKGSNGQVDLGPPSPAEIGQMIRHPARAAGLDLEEDPAGGERLEDVLRDAAAAQPASLPLLEFTLDELYRRRRPDGLLTLAAYRELGGLEGAIGRRAEEVFAGLPAEVQAELPAVARAVVRIETIRGGDGAAGEGEAVVARRAPASEVARSGEAARLVEALVEARLLVSELVDGVVTVAVAHEALLRRWPRLAEQIASDRDFLRLRARLGTAVRRWEEAEESADFLWSRGIPRREAAELAEAGEALGDSERRFLAASLARGRRIAWARRAATAALALLAVVALTAALWADRERRRAERESAKSQAALGYLVDLFSLATPERARGRTITAREILDRGAATVRHELADQPEVRLELLGALGRAYHSLGLEEAAEALLVEALALSEELHGEAPPTAAVLHNLSAVYWRQGRHDRAEELIDRALAIDRSPESLVQLAGLRRLRGDLAGAAPLLAEALAKHGGSSLDPMVVKVHYEMANLAGDEGDLARSERLHRQVLADLQALRPADHPEIAAAHAGLADVLVARDQLAAAEAEYRRALEIERRVLPAASADLGSTLTSLGEVQRARGRSEEARATLTEALEVTRRALGPSHPGLAEPLNNLAAVHRDAGELETAESLLRQALSLLERAPEGADRHTATTLNNLAAVYHQRGDLAEARELYERAIRIETERLGERHPSLGEPLVNLAHVLGHQGELEAGIERAEAAVAAYTNLGAEHPSVAWALGILGQLEAESGDLAAAQAAFGRAAAIARQAHGLADSRTRTHLLHLGGLSVGAGDPRRGVEALELLLEGQRQAGVEEVEVANTLALLATALVDAGRAEEAEERARQALEIRRRVLAADSWQIAVAENVLGAALAAGGDVAAAEPLLTRSHQRLRAALGDDHLLTRRAADRLAALER